MKKSGRRKWLLSAGLTSIFAVTGLIGRAATSEKSTSKDLNIQNEKPKLIVAIANDAQDARQILESGFVGFIWVREFCTYEFNKLNEVSDGRINGMLIDGHLDKQISIASKIKPRPSKILVVSNGTKKGDVKANSIRKKLDDMGFNSFVTAADPPPYTLVTINDRLTEAQAILMTPIQSLFSSDKMRLWLLMSIKQRTPMIGAWRDYQITAGALAGYVYGEDEVERVQLLALQDLEVNRRWPKTGYKPEVRLQKNTGIAKYYSIQIEG
jgi:hypothetical protein